MGVYSLSKSGISNWSKYSNVAANNGQTSDFELISSQFLTSSVSSVSFTNLQNYSQYKHLQLRVTARSDAAPEIRDMYIRINGDGGSNYSWHEVYGFNGSMGAYGVGSQTSAYAGSIAGSTAAANLFGPIVIDIVDFASTSKNKTIKSLSGVPHSGATNVIALASGAWLSTSAITSIQLYPSGGNLITCSRFSLYGVK
jgi:hypothetical protein